MLIHAWQVTGTPTKVNLWCHRCQFPAGVEVPVYLISVLGVRLFRTRRYCIRCEESR